MYNGETPLHKAAYRANLASAKLLLDAGADVNARDDDGETPFFKAVHGLFQQEGREHETYCIEAEDNDTCDSPPVRTVTYEETIAMIDFLVSRGAELKALNNDGYSANSSHYGNDFRKYLMKIGVFPEPRE